MSKRANIIIAGGKTGGHLFPGIAVANALHRLSQDVTVLFVGTTAPFEIETLKKYGFDHTAIVSKPVKGGTILSKIISIITLLISLTQAMMIMKRVKPGFVLGVGGFSSFAVVLAAWIFKIPTAIQEQNAFPGLTNRMLARFASIIFTSFENTSGFSDNPKTRYVGNPVRKTESKAELEIEQKTAQNFSALKKLKPEKFTLLVTGGSQGAKSINSAFIKAVGLMGEDALNYNIIHQTGAADESDIQQAYERLNLPATARAFYHDMPRLQEMADLVITRAGAGTLSELCAKGKPAILVPYPHAADDHQTFNAKALEEHAASIMIPDNQLDGQVLKDTIADLIKNKAKLDQMRQRMLTLAMPDADEKIAKHILKTMKSEG